MIDREHVLWSALYAAAWFQSAGLGPGVMYDEERAKLAALRADRALEALKLVRPEAVE